ncbi:polymerase, partial [Rhodobacter sp. TJ_12]|nr:polymerase [Rhodobacter sp. TJ_12]
LVWMAPHAHNGYRDTLLSLGLVGLALLVVVIVRALRQGAALLSREPSEPWLVLNVLVAVFLVMNMTESLLLQQNNFLFILFVTAALMFSRRETPT